MNKNKFDKKFKALRNQHLEPNENINNVISEQFQKLSLKPLKRVRK